MTDATRPNESPVADNLPSGSDGGFEYTAILEERHIWNLPVERRKIAHALFKACLLTIRL
jgi:hypothetical protein